MAAEQDVSRNVMDTPAVAAATFSPGENPNFTSKVGMILRPFALNRVALLEGRVQDELEINRKYLHEGAPKELGDIALDPTTVLHLFRHVAGLPAPGRPMGHTDQPDSGRAQGQYSGHVLSALAMMVAATGDQELKKRSDEIVAGLAEVQASYRDGYLSAWPKREWDKLEDMEHYCFDVPYYCQHKLMAGLWDQYRLAGSTQALAILTRSADWFVARYKRQSPELIHYVQHRFENGGMMELYLNLYGQTGNGDYLMAALAMGKPDWFDQLAKQDDRATRVHGNVHIPLIIGLARHYELTGDLRSRRICEFFWDRVVNTRSYATGGSTVLEGYGLANELSRSLCDTMVESCTVYNMLKLTRHLFAWTGDARYGDFYEKAYFNHIIGSIGTTGAIKTYSQPLSHGGRKEGHGPTSCCYGTGLESFSKLGDSIYCQGKHELYVNLYIASTLDWADQGLRLKQETAFPESDTAKFTVEASKPMTLAITFRVPWWATKGITAKLNGTAVETSSVKPSSWLVINREWKSGDTVELAMPMSLHSQAMPDNPSMVAIMYGPLVLAGELDDADFAADTGTFMLKDRVMDELVPAKYYFTGPLDRLDTWIKPVEGHPLAFRTTGQPVDVVLRPYNEFRPHERADYSALIDAQGLDLSFKAGAGPAGSKESRGSQDRYDSRKRFAVYWVMAGNGESSPLQPIRDEYAQFLERKSRMIDVVMPRHATERTDGRNPQVSGKVDYSQALISAAGENWFGWDMTVSPDKPVNLLVQHTSRLMRPSSHLMRWNDSWNSAFGIRVDGKTIATKTRHADDGAWISCVEYPIPEELTKGKTKITVTFVPHTNSQVVAYCCATAFRRE